MSNWQKWANKPPYDEHSDRLVCVLMISRNKDNKDVKGFRERRRSFLGSVPFGIDPKIMFHPAFRSFVDNGVQGEFSRLYVSLNARDNKMIRKILLERLIFDESLSMAGLGSVICEIAAKKECAKEKYWMFDVDPIDNDPRCYGDWINQLVSDIITCGKFNSINSVQPEVTCNKTPHGYAICVKHGFDCRPIFEKWNGIVTLKRDDLLCIDWAIKTE